MPSESDFLSQKQNTELTRRARFNFTDSSGNLKCEKKKELFMFS